MPGRFSEILDAAFKDEIRRRGSSFSKEDYFSDDPAAIQAEAVLNHIDDVIETLAARKEFITEKEWFEKRHGHQRNKSLCELAGDRGDHLLFEHGYVCNQRTQRMVPRPQRGVPLNHSPRFRRMGRQEPASEQDNIEFWQACESGNMEFALMFWEEKDVDVNFSYKGRGDKEKLSAIAAAARQGHDIVILFLLEAGANPDSRSKNLATPLMMAGKYCHDTTVMAVTDGLVNYYRDNPEKLWESIVIKERDTLLTAYEYALANCAPATADYIMRAAQRDISGDRVQSAELEAMAIAMQEEISRRRAKYERRDEEKPAPVQEIQPPEPTRNEAALARLDAPIARDALMQPVGDKKSLFRQALEAGKLEKALQALASSGGKLSKEDFLQREPGANNSNIEQIAEQGQLAVIFQPENWVNNVREMQEVWARVPRQHQSQLDGQDGRPSFKRILQEANTASIKALQSGTRVVGE